jgi:hypothetical protein
MRGQLLMGATQINLLDLVEPERTEPSSRLYLDRRYSRFNGQDWCNGTLFMGWSKAKARLSSGGPWHRNIELGRSRASRNALSRAGPAQQTGELA